MFIYIAFCDPIDWRLSNKSAAIERRPFQGHNATNNVSFLFCLPREKEKLIKIYPFKSTFKNYIILVVRKY